MLSESTTNLIGTDNVTLDIEDTAMQPRGIESTESSLIGRSHKQSIPFWDDDRIFNRAVSTATVVPSTRLSWHNISVKVAESRNSQRSLLGSGMERMRKLTHTEQKPVKMRRDYILDNVFGGVESGEVLAILGSSGCGKTTMLNVLTQRNLEGLQVEGFVRVNGQQLASSEMRRICAYVQQDDLFVGSMTVKEHLTFYAALRMGRSYTTAEKRKRVDDIIRELGLSSCENTYVGMANRIRGISGGERKRLAFACETLTSPPLLFCDEPTSGLDSFRAQQVVQVLKKLAHRKGMTIVVTIHQPSSQVFAMFDRIHLMAEGRVAFNGRSVDAIQMWNDIGYPLPHNYNPADHFMKTLGLATGRERRRSLDRIERICDHYAESAQGRAVLEEAMHQPNSKIGSGIWTEDTKLAKQIRSKPRSSWFTQLRVLTWRSFLTTVRDPVLLKVRLFQTIIVGVITGLIYLGTTISQSTIMNINGVLFTLVCDMNYLFQFVVVEVFCDEMPIFLREHTNGLYRTDTYFIAKNIAETPQYVVLPVILTTILYWMAGLAPDFGAFALCCLINVLMANTAISIGYAMSCIFKDLSIAVNVMPAFVMPAMAFAGFFINQNTLPIYFIYFKYISYFGYAYEALVVNEWSRVDQIPGCTGNMTCYQTGADVIESLTFQEWHLYPNIGALLIMTLVIRFIAFFALYIRASRKK